MPSGARKAEPKRTVATQKLPSWHLTGVKTMEYVKGVDNWSQKKKEKAEKENKVKREAIDKYRAAERRTMKMTKKCK